MADDDFDFLLARSALECRALEDSFGDVGVVVRDLNILQIAK